MTPAQVIRHFGTQVKAASYLGRSQSTIAGWVAKGYVPVPVQHMIQNLTSGKLRATKNGKA